MLERMMLSSRWRVSRIDLRSSRRHVRHISQGGDKSHEVIALRRCDYTDGCEQIRAQESTAGDDKVVAIWLS
ncbi:hypothetical protein M6B38_294555 [Iris pallida]|uniref:Uncharacterized protein n=1 Tax=Iris pallida TaxID=29817 RepID=A0AAX6HSH8_IRIPA|nr:hypothetical protein M6B38_294555 [Iris pallida]